MLMRNVVRFTTLTFLAGAILAAASVPASAQAVEYLPVCTLANCLNPRVLSKAGVGTANATADGKVTVEDATKYCAKYNPGYKYCAQDQVDQGGTGGGAKPRSVNYHVSADCKAGVLNAVDGNRYTYVGTWPDGFGQGQPRFKGALSQIGGRQYQQDSNGLANGSTTINQIAQEANSGESLTIQWKVLCAGAPAPAVAETIAAAPAPAGARNVPPAATPAPPPAQARTTAPAAPAPAPAQPRSSAAAAPQSSGGGGGANGVATAAGEVAGAATAFGSLFGGRGGAQPASNGAAAPTAAGTPGDPCGGNARCYSAGPFAATVTQLTAVQSATSRANRTISLNVEFRNLGNQPITLAYKARTSTAVDNQSNQFFDGGVTGIGVADGRSVNTQFVLNPGQTRSARFALWRRADRTVIGTAWTWDVTIAEVQVLANGQQVQTVKEDSMHFTNLISEGPTNTNKASAPGTPPADAIKSLGGIFGRK